MRPDHDPATAPVTLVVAIAAFLMSLLPFQRAFAEYRSSSYVGDLNGIPDYVMGVNARVLIWAFVSIAMRKVPPKSTTAINR